jgi:hypothetical protein
MSRLLNRGLQVLTSPDAPVPNGGGVSGRSSEMSKNDIFEFLNADDDKKDVIPLKDEKDEKDDKEDDDEELEETPEEDEDSDESEDEESEDEEEDELAELESELEEPDDEKLELVTPVRRKDILKKYPQLFKDFPYLEKAYYREQQFTELLPTIEDAKEAVDKASTLDKFEKDLLSGNTEIMLQAVKTNPKAFNKIVDNYMGALAKVDEKAYHHVVGNTIKHTIMSMVKESRRSNNETLGMAAQILNQFVFGSSEFEPPSSLSTQEKPEEDTKEKELSERERKFNQNRFRVANSELENSVNNSYKATIEANIDPRGTMSDYVRRNASREAFENLTELIEKDTRFKVLVDKLWEQAIKEDYSKTAVDRIRGAFKSKAKTLLAAVIKKARNEALRGMGKRVSKDKDEETPTPKKVQAKDKDKPSSHERRGGKISKASDIPKGMSTLDFLMHED